VSTVLYTIYKRKRWYKEKRGRLCGLGMKKKSDVNLDFLYKINIMIFLYYVYFDAD